MVMMTIPAASVIYVSEGFIGYVLMSDIPLHTVALRDPRNIHHVAIPALQRTSGQVGCLSPLYFRMPS